MCDEVSFSIIRNNDTDKNSVYFYALHVNFKTFNVSLLIYKFVWLGVEGNLWNYLFNLKNSFTNNF